MALISSETGENCSHLYLCPHLLNTNLGVASMYAAANISCSVAHTDGLCILQHCVACMML